MMSTPIQQMRTGHPMRITNVLKSMSAAEPIMMFGGSPTSVPMPPVSDRSAAASR